MAFSVLTRRGCVLNAGTSPPRRQNSVCSSWAPSSLETLSLVTSLSEAVPCWRLSCQPLWISTDQSKLELRSSPGLLRPPRRKEMLSAQLKIPTGDPGFALPSPKPSLSLRAEGYSPPLNAQSCSNYSLYKWTDGIRKMLFCLELCRDPLGRKADSS